MRGENSELQAQLVTTEWVSSWIGRARPADRFDPDPGRRASAWARWAFESCVEMRGMSDRPYVALRLEGSFHDPGGRGPLVSPHLEIPQRVLHTPDPAFPDRLAQMGNGLLFNWWLRPEVTAARRSLFNVGRGDIGACVDLLNERRGGLVDTVAALAVAAANSWTEVEALLVEDPEGLSASAAGDFDADEVAEFFPAGSELELTVTYDPKLRASSGSGAARRVGIWQVAGADSVGDAFSFGVITPRLTKNSQFRDQLFAIDRESPASLLVRGLLLRRLLERHLGGTPDAAVADTVAPRRSPAHLRAVVAQVGQRLPEARLETVVRFVQAYPDAEDAWEELSGWAARTGTLLTVHAEGFCAAHRRALRMVRRAEDVDRDDANVVLPLGWDNQGRVVRVTFSARRSD